MYIATGECSMQQSVQHGDSKMWPLFQLAVCKYGRKASDNPTSCSPGLQLFENLFSWKKP